MGSNIQANMIIEFFSRIKFCKNSERLGPDMFWTHWRLHFKSSMKKLCKKKFNYFADTAKFRPGAYAHYTSNISIGKRVVIRPGTVLSADENGIIEVQEDVLIGMNVHIYCGNHRFDSIENTIYEQRYEAADVFIRKGAWIGANVTILAGNAVVGAGSVVTKNVDPFTVVAGIIKKLK